MLKQRITDLALKAKKASTELAKASTQTKNNALKAMAKALAENAEEIIEANQSDVKKAKQNGMKDALIDRLFLDKKRIAAIISDLKEVIELKDPVGEIAEQWSLKNGLKLQRVRVPLGVVGLIYESRPNVTVDASALCLKSGNAIILRGGSEAINSNKALANVISNAITLTGLPKECIQLIEETDRQAVNELIRLHGLIDVIIPRGGGKLIQTVVENASVPVIETGEGNCHLFIDRDADQEKAMNILINAKTQRPGVCNAIEKLLIHSGIAKEFLPKAVEELKKKNVEVRGCRKAKEIVSEIKQASEEDWGKEYLDLIIAVKLVDSLDEAIAHINKYSTKHSESIVSENKENIEKFLREIDSAAVYANASTRFTDGNQFGLGMEIGISTQKLHARGPMSLRELTSTKFVVRGNGQIRA